MAKFGFHRTPPLIVFLTDFGARDSYVGTMKGVVYSICEDARIVDLTHGIAPQDVTGAAFTLNTSYAFFPPGSIFVCVVDPGVGGKRDIVCMKADARIFLAPDNGLLSLLRDGGKVDAVRTLKNKELWLKEISSTFHGRDIFAPVAAHLAAGVDIEEVGPEKARIRGLELSKPVRTTGGALKGKVIYVDQFGNMITNIGASTLQTILKGALEDIAISVGERTINGIVHSYSEAEEGELLALVGSSGFLEIAANKGSARDMLGCERGCEVTLR